MHNFQSTVIIAFLEQDNLGVGYLASMLAREQQPVKVLDFQSGKKNIFNSLLACQPRVVGFSIIFQYHIYEFKELIDFLREQGITCHFTAGGHYPSLRYEDTFKILDQLDSIVLFEGEHTFLELVKKVNEDKDWKQIQGIAYRENGKVLQNELRPLETDLDTFPPPARQPLREYALGKKYATLTAGRGCFYNCSFCSIRRFYSKPPGPVKRLRRPEMVVREMELLQQQHDCSVFMFQDDDFPVTAEKGAWIATFCSLLHEKGLSDKIAWKINCRADEVDYESFARMKEAGLFLVYLGIESGTEKGLQLMNKRLTPQENINAIERLKKLGINYDYGFMLFEPSSTLETVKDNLDFLETICGDGSSPITFCKMLPYAETQIEKQLLEQGRLKGDVGFLDYDFLDSRLNRLCPFLIDCFRPWISSHNGLLNLARWTRYNILIAEKFYSDEVDTAYWGTQVDNLVAKSNAYFIDTAKQVTRLVGQNLNREEENRQLAAIYHDVNKHHDRWQQEFLKLMDTIQKRKEPELAI